MTHFRVDLHIHSLLSPCADLSMTPNTIIERSLAQGLSAIAICDHNSTQQSHLIHQIGKRAGLEVLYGVELTTKEEVHCVAILPNKERSDKIQNWIDEKIEKRANVAEIFGDQVWVDEDELIEGEIEWYLNSPLGCSIDECAEMIKSLGGVFIPAHIDRQSNSLIGQLGFIDPTLPIDAIEYNHQHLFDQLIITTPQINQYSCYTASDAHHPDAIGTRPSLLFADNCSFEQVKRAFANEDGRHITPLH